MDIKEASQGLLRDKKITRKEYDTLEKVGFLKNINLAKFLTSFGNKAAKSGSYIAKKNEAISKVVKPNLTNAIMPALLLPAAIASVGSLVTEPLVTKYKINKSYKQLKEKTPQLSGVDDNKIKDYFNVIKTFSPKSASNPLVAGALVNKMIEFGGVDHKLIQDLSSIDMGDNALRSGVITGATKALGGLATSN